MICSKCAHREYLRYKDIEAFDCGELKKVSYDNIDYCHHLNMPCDDAYLECEYREIPVEFEKLESIKKITEKVINNIKPLEPTIDAINLTTALYLINEILEGE